jgi:hypothetical protein
MAASQPSYGWMHNALANWAVEAVYPGNPVLLADAACHMNSNFLSITSQAAGACPADASRSRDHGAYLFYQYIGRTMGNPKVRELLAATTTQASALAAVDANVVGGLRALWPKYAKTLWNQVPVSNAGRPAFRNWDGQTAVPQLAPDHPTPVNANRGALAEAKTSLSDIVANVSTRFYHFTFSDTTTRTLMFRNTFYPLYKAGRKVSVQALWRTDGGTWIEENWSAKEWIGFCRDKKAQRLTDLVVIVASGETGTVTQIDAATKPTFKRNNIGCWGYSGSVKRTDLSDNFGGPTGSGSGSIVVTGTAAYDLQQGGLQYNDASTGRLRVPIAAPMFRSIDWSLTEAYKAGVCNYAANGFASDKSIVLGGSASGVIVINNFAESLPASLRQDQLALLGAARGAYLAEGHSLFSLTPGLISGPSPECGPPFDYRTGPGAFLLTNETVAVTPVIRTDGHLAGSLVTGDASDSSTFEWDLAPLREP